MKKHLYIERLDRDYAKSWTVIFRRGDSQGSNREVLKQRSFTDRQYGSKEKSLQAAIKWRNYWAPRLKKPLDEPIQNKHIAFTRSQANTTGVIGVTEIIVVQQPPRNSSFGYKATWRQTVNGKRVYKTKSFYYDITEDGAEQHAFKKACEIRRRMVSAHYLP